MNTSMPIRLICGHTDRSLNAQPFPTPEEAHAGAMHPAGYWHQQVEPSDDIPKKVNEWIRMTRDREQHLLELTHPILGCTRGWILFTGNPSNRKEVYREAIFKAGTANEEITDFFAGMLRQTNATTDPQ